MAASPGRWDATGEVLAEGPLWKRSDRLRLWRERYCVLRDSGPGPVLDYWRTALERWGDNPVRGSLAVGRSAGMRPETSQVDGRRSAHDTDPVAPPATGSCAIVRRSGDESRTFMVLARPDLSGVRAADAGTQDRTVMITGPCAAPYDVFPPGTD